MSQGWKVATVAAAVAIILSTPLIWLLDGPDAGQLVGASVQAATGVGGLVWALCQRAAERTGPQDTSANTGSAEATGGGSAHTGVRRPGGVGNGTASAERTGNATAHGSGSSAGTGVDYS